MNFEGLSLRGRTALVTGGSRGIGRAVVQTLATAGASVVVNYFKGHREAEETVRLALDKGVDATLWRADVSRSDEVKSMVDSIIETFGRLDILICNAGIWGGAPVETMDEGLWDRTLEINLKGTWTVCRAVIPSMKRQKWGRIVIVSSTAGQRGESGVSNYAASKGGQISFAKSLATELASDGINVNVVAPGWVETEMNDEVFAEQNRRRVIEQTIPLGRIASPEDIARPIVFLCTDWSRHITGEVLNVNGGSVLCG
jgi:3-oxoacyl-[acyl-carrier protein] reductase